MATRWLESIDLMKAEISEAHFVMVAVVQVPLVVPVLPLHRGSLASSQAMIVGSLLYRETNV